MRGFIGGNYSLIKFPLESINFVFTPRIAPIGGKIIEVKSTLQAQAVVVYKQTKIVGVVESGPKPEVQQLE